MKRTRADWNPLINDAFCNTLKHVRMIYRGLCKDIQSGLLTARSQKWPQSRYIDWKETRLPSLIFKPDFSSNVQSISCYPLRRWKAFCRCDRWCSSWQEDSGTDDRIANWIPRSHHPWLFDSCLTWDRCGLPAYRSRCWRTSSIQSNFCHRGLMPAACSSSWNSSCGQRHHKGAPTTTFWLKRKKKR